ncbi:MAG: hypothetical protein Q8K26_00055, partial [Candidatus Gracilibacteria bacterium]|nr:hypothetical protein [Candidatus Gracilibacteria bacterium]
MGRFSEFLYDQEETFLFELHSRLKNRNDRPYTLDDNERPFYFGFFEEFSKKHPNPKDIKESLHGAWLIKEMLLFSMGDIQKIDQIFEFYDLPADFLTQGEIHWALREVYPYNPLKPGYVENFKLMVKRFHLVSDSTLWDTVLMYGKFVTETRDYPGLCEHVLHAVQEFSIPKAYAYQVLSETMDDTWTANGYEKRFRLRFKHEDNRSATRGEVFPMLMEKLGIGNEEEEKVVKEVFRKMVTETTEHESTIELFERASTGSGDRREKYTQWMLEILREKKGSYIPEKFPSHMERWVGTQDFPDFRAKEFDELHKKWLLDDLRNMDYNKYGYYKTTHNSGHNLALYKNIPLIELENAFREGIQQAIKRGAGGMILGDLSSFIELFLAFANFFKEPEIIHLITELCVGYIRNEGYTKI